MSTPLPLLDLCLFAVCNHLSACTFYNGLPDFLRKRLALLMKQEPLFQKLEVLNFSHCYTVTDDDVKSISALKNLKSLDLSHCDQLTGIVLSYIGQITSLKCLSLNHCTKVNVGFFFLRSIQLTELYVSFCEIQDPVMPLIAELSSLRTLDLQCNRLTDEGAAHLEKLTNLQKLILSMNPLITDKTLETLSKLKELVALNINFCKLLTGDGIDKLSGALPNLAQLEMVGCDRAITEAKTRPLILLAEDSKIQARMISMVLNRYNFDVEIATDGEMALEMFRANPKYDLILMDVVMPVMDGISCVKQIREHETAHGLRRTPIIIQTADVRESQRSVSLEAGCDEFMQKPLDRSCISLAKELMQQREKNVPARSSVKG